MTQEDPSKRLMDAAMTFMKEGTSPTTRALAERAGVNIAAINYYFKGKDNLMAKALDEAAYNDLILWVQTQLSPEETPLERLRHFALFLGRIHGNYHTIANLQLQLVVLKGHRERATALACQTMAGLIAEHRELDVPDEPARIKAASLMASVHYLSIFNHQFEEMTNIIVHTDEGRDAYVLGLLKSHGLSI